MLNKFKDLANFFLYSHKKGYLMKKYSIIATLFLCFLLQNLDAKETRLLRYPHISGNLITFSYAGDIYTVDKSGGLARRITTSEGIEIFPRFSPDGKWIAFSGEYDGNREVYIIPSSGGVPKRLTYSMDMPGIPERMGPEKAIMQWTKDGKRILYRSRQQAWNPWRGQLYFVSVDGGLPETFPFVQSGFASLSPDETKITYNRIFREYRPWKRYRGGQAEDIYVFDINTKINEKITDNPAQNFIPMWYKDKIYYCSDIDKTINIFVYDTKTKQSKKVTTFDYYDVKFPSLGGDFITFENGGYIYVMDLATEKYERINVEIAEDFQLVRESFVNVKDNITAYSIAPDAKRAVFSARGDIFTVPAEKGNIRNLTKSPGAHDRNAVWSPDGKWIAFVSDKSGEDEIWLVKPDGSDLTQLTNTKISYKWEIEWSPDSKKILCSDKTMELYYVDIATKKVTQIIKSKSWEIRDYAWSPDSKWIAFSDGLLNGNSAIFIYSLDSKKIEQVSDEYFSSTNPSFSECGKYLFFVSNRTFNPTINTIEWNFSFNNMYKIYGITLQDTVQSPFAFESDETVAKAEDEAKAKPEKTKDEKAKTSSDTRIDFKNIANRIFELPIKSANYWGLMARKDKVYYVRIADGQKPAFCSFDFNTKKENELGNLTGYDITPDGKKIIFRSAKDFYITDLGDKIRTEKGRLNLSNMQVELDRKAEWKQIFEETWRQFRDFFYDPDMHKVDWKAMHEKYAQLLPYVVHRSDLTYILSEMISELNVGHAYVGGGEMPEVPAVPIGLLGATFELDKKSGFYKITKIYEGRNWEEQTRSPLTEPGINVKEGDFLIAIDGQNLTAENNPFKLLLNKANQYVTLKVNSSPNESGAKEYTVKTIKNENKLIYYNWVEGRRRYVEEKTDGKVGYIHVPDMGVDNGLIEFAKYFYPQARKEALIVDDRYNGGGNVSPMIIERLRRELVVAKNARNQEYVFTNPDAVITGPIVCLINELSASDGDLFPYQFKTLGIGKLIGKRSWGGVIGIRGSNPFLDGGYLYKPEFANFGADGTWILEGVGQSPDIEIENDVYQEYIGNDQQLDRAIEEILKEMKNDKKLKVPKSAPPYPDKR